MKFPTLWKRTTMRGCGPQCRRLDLDVETRRTSATTLEVRHAAPAGETPRWIEQCPCTVGTPVPTAPRSENPYCTRCSKHHGKPFHETNEHDEALALLEPR